MITKKKYEHIYNEMWHAIDKLTATGKTMPIVSDFNYKSDKDLMKSIQKDMSKLGEKMEKLAKRVEKIYTRKFKSPPKYYPIKY